MREHWGLVKVVQPNTAAMDLMDLAHRVQHVFSSIFGIFGNAPILDRFSWHLSLISDPSACDSLLPVTLR